MGEKKLNYFLPLTSGILRKLVIWFQYEYSHFKFYIWKFNHVRKKNLKSLLFVGHGFVIEIRSFRAIDIQSMLSYKTGIQIMYCSHYLS